MPIASIARRLLGSARRSGSRGPASGPAGGGSTDARIGRGVRTVVRRFLR